MCIQFDLPAKAVRAAMIFKAKEDVRFYLNDMAKAATILISKHTQLEIILNGDTQPGAFNINTLITEEAKIVIMPVKVG
jgi:hypothetical protein